MSLTIVRNDITKMQVDAIVNTANRFVGYARGTDSAVYHAAGVDKLMAARDKIGPMNPGQVAITEGFDLPANYIIHVVGAKWRGGDDGEIQVVQECYADALKCAHDMECQSIAIPVLASGNFGFPKPVALSIAMGEIRRFLSEYDMEVYLVVFDDDTAAVTEEMYGKLESYVESNLEAGEYVEYAKFEIPNDDINYSIQACVEDEALASIDMEAPDPAPQAPAPAPQAQAPAKKKRSLFRWKREEKRSERALDNLKTQVSETFAEKLQRLIDSRLVENPWVYTNAFMSKQTFNKIINNQSVPKKNTVLILAVTLHLTLDETIDLLARAGHAFSPSSLSDTIMKYYIENGIYDWEEIDAAFLHFDLAPIIGIA